MFYLFLVETTTFWQKNSQPNRFTYIRIFGCICYQDGTLARSILKVSFFCKVHIYTDIMALKCACIFFLSWVHRTNIMYYIYGKFQSCYYWRFAEFVRYNSLYKSQHCNYCGVACVELYIARFDFKGKSLCAERAEQCTHNKV